MKRFIWFFTLGTALFVSHTYAQNANLSDPCNAMTASSKNFLTFEKFDKELRVALTRQDAVALAFLVNFPLRVNDAGGTISIDDAAALKTHFQEVFTPAVRKEILSEKNDNVGCPNDEGIGYARGVIWVNASERGYAIQVVNRDAVPPFKMSNWNTPKINFICQTQTHRIVVDTVAGGNLRYRAWNKPRPLSNAPDLVMTKGDGTVEGTNVCAYPVYTFKNGGTEYKVEGGLGCWGYADGAPTDATGQLEVTVKDKPAVDAWCY